MSNRTLKDLVWHLVVTSAGLCYAADFIDGILVKSDMGNESVIFCQGWKVKLKTGDMDYNALTRRD